MENSREELLKLDKQRLEIEKEINELTNFLTQPGMPGVEGSLIDKEGFPISGVDLYSVRQARQKLIMKQNDSKNLMKIIEIKMSKYFEEINNEKKTEDNININQNQYIDKEEPISIPVLEEKNINKNINNKKEPFITITEISENSPAEEAGLKVNDNIITFDNVLYKGVSKNPLQTLAEIVKDKIGQNIPIEILRKNEENILEVKHLTLRPHIWEGRGVLGCKLNLIMN
jgi:26S proteasome non-ATPase regulatory subunit 9